MNPTYMDVPPPDNTIKHIHISKVGGTHCLECGQQLPQSTIDEQGDSESPELQAKLEEIKSLPQKPSKRIEYALRIIERLLADPIGSQMKHKEIKMMFDLIAIELYPPIIITTKGSDLPTEDSKPSAGHSEAQS